MVITTFHKLILSLASCVMCLAFLATNYRHNNVFNDVSNHAAIGYSIYVYDTPKPSSIPLTFTHNRFVPQDQSSQPVTFHIPPIQDTIGYGVLLGLLWKITHSLSYFDIQFLQCLLFPLSILAIYAISVLLFAQASIAFICALCQLLFFPLLFLNSLAVRDIWAYYGVVLLVYLVLAWTKKQVALPLLIAGGLTLGLCQWIRSTLFASVALVPIMLLLYAIIYHKALIQKIGWLILIIWSTNIISFWIPFCAYNKVTYGRYCVGPKGQALLEGLGEFPNPWGYKFGDRWFGEHIAQQCSARYGTQEFDDVAHQLFWNAMHQNPLPFFMNIIRRLPDALLPGLPWILKKSSPYATCNSLMSKLTTILYTPSLIADILLRHVYIRLFLMLGYLGMFIAWRKHHYQAIFVLFGGVIIGGWSLLPSHIEYRYLIPYYWPLGVFAGYALHTLFNVCKARNLKSTRKVMFFVPIKNQNIEN